MRSHELPFRGLLGLFSLCNGERRGASDDSILEQNTGIIPLIAQTRHRLIIAQSFAHRVLVFPPDRLDEPAELKDIHGILALAVDRDSGWVAVCADLGLQLILFQEDHPELKYVRDLSGEGSPDCAGLSLAVDPDDRPLVWMGSPGDRRIVKYDILSARRPIVREFAPVSGPFAVEEIGNFIFSSNHLLAPDSALPLVLDKGDGRVVVGNSLGDEAGTGLQREYSPSVYPDSVTGKVFYLRSHLGVLAELHGFPPIHRVLQP